MRYVGKITEWNDAKGFGFVMPNGGRDRVFVHIKAFERRHSHPAAGSLVSYDLLKDDKGRFNASCVRIAGEEPNVRSRRYTLFPRRTMGFLAIAAIVLGWLLGKIPTIFVAAYSALSLFAIALYACDKSAALRDKWRTQESKLHLVGILGGWPGALFAQGQFRLKTKKLEFQIEFWITVLLNCSGLCWLLTSGSAIAINQAILGP